MIKFLFSLLFYIYVILFNNVQLSLADEVDLDAGEQIFSQNCTACHAGGQNVLVSDRTLEKGALEYYKMNDVDKIIYQVTNGKNSMPAFGDRLSSQDVENVANFVLDKAYKGW